MGKIFTPPALPKVKPVAMVKEDDTAAWNRLAHHAPDPAVSPDAALEAWLADDGRGLPWVDRQRARQYAASCIAHGVPFTRDDGAQGPPREWRAWAEAV